MKAILFFHPGQEYPENNGDIKAWSLGRHSRNFIKSAAADYIDAKGARCKGDIGFWGEWEAHATIEKDAAGHRIFTPYLDLNDLPAEDGSYGEGKCGSCGANASSESPQDTDPFVFGERFRYGNCQQPSSTTLKNLEPGSLILFASTQGGKHLLDTASWWGTKFPHGPPSSTARSEKNWARISTPKPRSLSRFP